MLLAALRRVKTGVKQYCDKKCWTLPVNRHSGQDMKTESHGEFSARPGNTNGFGSLVQWFVHVLSGGSFSAETASMRSSLRRL